MKKIKYQTIYPVLFVLVIPLLLFLNSCVRRQAEGDFIAYTGNRAILSVVKNTAKIGVIAYSKPTTYDALLGSSTNENAPLTELHTLRTIVESVLIANGFNVGRDDVYDLLTNTNYQLLGFGFAGSKLKTEVTDPINTWFSLKMKLFKDTGITHLLVISMVDQYKYNVSLIDLRSQSVVVSFAINADSQGGWDSFFKPLSSKQWVDYNSDYEGQYYAWGQLADKIVSLLEGRR